MGQDLLTIARAPVNADAFNAPMYLAAHGFPEFGPDAALIIRPHKQSKAAQRYVLRGNLALRGTSDHLNDAPLDPDEAEEYVRGGEAALEAYEAGYARLVIAGMADVCVLDSPATAEHVEAADVEEFLSARPEAVKLEDGKGKVLGVKVVTVSGFKLKKGSDCLPWSPRNVWKLLALRPSLAPQVYSFATDDANFPELPDPLAFLKSGGGGAPSTSSTGTPPEEGSAPQRRGGGRRSSRKSSSG